MINHVNLILFRNLTAVNGYFENETFARKSCLLPPGVTLCEYDICASASGGLGPLAVIKSLPSTSTYRLERQQAVLDTEVQKVRLDWSLWSDLKSRLSKLLKSSKLNAVKSSSSMLNTKYHHIPKARSSKSAYKITKDSIKKTEFSATTSEVGDIREL